MDKLEPSHIAGRNVKWKTVSKFLKRLNTVTFSSVQSLSRVRLFATPWIAAHQASLSITNSQSSLKLTLLSYKKECIWVGSNEVDEPGAYYTEWS